jgi:tetratricopeptide (TPR) repeat protein
MTPERIGKYQIVGKLGQGAMGEVFRGHDPVLNRDVAIKRISSGLDADESLRKRFEREAQAVALLSHPHIITVYELGFEGDQMFMAMELLEGIDLKHAMAQRKLSSAEKLATMEQICEGLAFAHARDLVHRDLKPANIHILPGGKVKIMDFGLARTAGSDMTSTGTVMGTPHYMSPEQVKGLKADARSDVFALGCVFYELFSGRKPFDAESMHGVLFKVMQDEPAPLAEIAPDVPHALVQVVERALAKDPAERFQSAGELLAGLRLARAAGAAGAARPAAERTEPARSPAVGAPGAQASAREASRSGTRPGTRPPERSSVAQPPAPRGRSYLGLGVVAGLVVVAAAAWGLRSLVTAPQPAAPQPQVARLLADAIATRVQLAQRRLDSSDFAAAVRDAESALKLDPANADAKAVLEEASDRLKRAEGAAAALREAQARGGDVAGAAYELMKVDPANAEADKAAQANAAAFRRQAEEARSTAAQTRESAENAGAKSLPAFADATALEGQGQQALQSGQFVAAARRFLEARIRFERAERAAHRP